MATIKISPLDSDDSNLLSPLTDEETKNIVGGMLPSEPGPRKPADRPPFEMIAEPTHTRVFDDTHRLRR